MVLGAEVGGLDLSRTSVVSRRRSVRIQREGRESLAGTSWAATAVAAFLDEVEPAGRAIDIDQLHWFLRNSVITARSVS